MKPAAFEYFRAGTIMDACSALREANGEARPIAGGQSLGPMLNLRLVQPSLLVDISGIAELSDFDEDDEIIRIGACITAADIEDQRAATPAVPVLSEVAAGIAYRAVRNRSTIGGSLCHADPAADWVNLLPALGASYVLTDGAKTRTVPAETFVTSAFETALRPSEILSAICIPKLSREARLGYVKISRKIGKFALAIGVVVFDSGRGVFRVVLGATQRKPVAISDAREIFNRQPGEAPFKIDELRVTKLLEEEGVTPGPALHLHLVALRRAAAKAFPS
jgi:aerobic carbon-monoxide dehydrogenase medium subunit